MLKKIQRNELLLLDECSISGQKTWDCFVISEHIGIHVYNDIGINLLFFRNKRWMDFTKKNELLLVTH